MAGANGRPYIVVGVDGSEASKDALRWAAHHADLIDAEVRAIGVWELVPAYPYPVPLDGDLRDYATKTLDASVAEVFGGAPADRLVTQVHRGHPAEVLIRESRGAELLVLGASGHGAFTDMLLGSVSQHCAHHAVCPLVIVRHPKHTA